MGIVCGGIYIACERWPFNLDSVCSKRVLPKFKNNVVSLLLINYSTLYVLLIPPLLRHSCTPDVIIDLNLFRLPHMSQPPCPSEYQSYFCPKKKNVCNISKEHCVLVTQIIRKIFKRFQHQKIPYYFVASQFQVNVLLHR